MGRKRWELVPFDLPPAFTRRLGPLPVWSWLVVGAVGVGGTIYYIKKRNGISTQPSASGLVPSTDLGAGTIPSDTGIGGGGGSDAGSTTPSVTNNYYYDDHIPPGSPSVPNPIVTPYYTVPGGQTGPVTVYPSGDSPSNPGWNTIAPSSSNPKATVQASQGSPGTIAGMSVLNLGNGSQIQVPDSTLAWFEQHPPAGSTALDNIQPGGPEIAVPYNPQGDQTAAINGGPVWVDVAGV